MARSTWTPDPWDPASPEPGTPSGLGFGAGCLLGAFAFVAFLVAWWSAHVGGFLEDTTIVAALSLTGAALVCALPLLERTWAPTVRGRAALRLSVALFGGVLFLGAHVLLGHPLIHRSFCSFGIGMDNPSAMTGPLLVVALAAGGGLCATALGAAGARLLLGNTGANRVVYLRWGAWAAGAAVAGLVALSTLARARRPDPTLAGYIASLPEIGRLPPPGHDDSGSPAVIAVGGVRVVRDAVRVALLRSGETSPLSPNLDTRRAAVLIGEVEAVLYRDAAHGLILIEDGRAHGAGVHGAMNGRVAFREADLTPVDLEVADLRDLTGPPAPWIAAAACGVLVALAVMLRRRALLRVLSDAPRHRAGRADGTGRVVLDEGPSCEPDPTGAPVPAGPVVVIPIGATTAPTYRTAPTLGRVLVVPGTLAELATAVRGAELNRCLAALAVLSLTAAPLLAAWVCGLGVP